MEERMLYDKFLQTAERADWCLMTDEYEVLAVAAFVVVAVLIWNRIRIGKRIRGIEIQIRELEKKINLLELQESRRLIMELNAKSEVNFNPRDTALEMGDGDIARTTSPPTAPAEPQSTRSAKLPE
jgi:hypothetical protein